MSLSAEEAARALHEIEAVSHRSGQLYRYQRTAPMLLLWGAIWLVGFGLTDLFPANANAFWIVLNIAGVLGCLHFGRQRSGDPTTRTGWRWLASCAGIFAFYLLVLVIFQPAGGKQSSALIVLIVALAYVLGGIWFGARFAVAGIVLAALDLSGYFVLTEHFYLWMAFVGGGALMLAGLWLRRT